MARFRVSGYFRRPSPTVNFSPPSLFAISRPKAQCATCHAERAEAKGFAFCLLQTFLSAQRADRRGTWRLSPAPTGHL